MNRNLDETLVEKLRGQFADAGLRAGDLVWVQAVVEGVGPTAEDNARSVLSALQAAVGSNGTLVTATPTESFDRGEIFDPTTTATQLPDEEGRVFAEVFRVDPSAWRSLDPMHAFSALGPLAGPLLCRLPGRSFGEDTVWDRLRSHGAKVCLIGIGLERTSVWQHLETMAGVPYRYDRLCTGRVREGNVVRKEGWVSSGRIRARNAEPRRDGLVDAMVGQGMLERSQVGGVSLEVGDYSAIISLGLAELAADPWKRVAGPSGDPVVLETERLGTSLAPISLPANADMMTMMQAVWRFPRDIVSDGYDRALATLGTVVRMKVHEYVSGTECWSWLIPERWTCHGAWLRTTRGEEVLSYANHPLHVASYSLPFVGRVSRDELFRHLSVHPYLPEAIPFMFHYYERNWGLCCSQRVKESLKDEYYEVEIRSEFSLGSLKVGEVEVRGSRDETIVLCAHLCHPAMANDDLAGVVVGIKVMQEMSRRTGLRYNYRLLILPETIGSVAYLSQNDALIPKMKLGMFLEMLGLENPIALQASFAGDSEIDVCCRLALREMEPEGWTGEYRSVVGNDERQFNSVGVRVPMVSISRVEKAAANRNHFYPEYHSSFDTPERVSEAKLAASAAYVLRVIEMLEGNRRPKMKYKGELFCSRFGVHVDAYENPEGNRRFFQIMDHFDGGSTISDIATRCGVSFGAVEGVAHHLATKGLVTWVD